MYLHPDLSSLAVQPEQRFDFFMQLQGQAFRQLEGRCTARVNLNGRSYFIKQHFGVGWKEIFKNLFQFKLPVLGAKNEWLALQKMQELSLSAAKALAFGSRGKNPARRQSFLLMEDLSPSQSLEDLCRHWAKEPPAFAIKLKLLREVARIARTLHKNGVNHRDFYLCHFLADKNLNLHLIDLHRAGIHRKLRNRWIIKDVAGLYFSSKDIGLSQRDLWRFMKHYRQASLRTILREEATFWLKVKTRGDNLYDAHAVSR